MFKRREKRRFTVSVSYGWSAVLKKEEEVTDLNRSNGFYILELDIMMYDVGALNPTEPVPSLRV